MKCINCKKELVISDIPYLNLESYNVGGSCLTSSQCCNTGYILKMNITYKLTPYTGDETEDDWGNKIIKSK